MIERYFSQAKVLIRLRSGSVGPYLPRFVSALEQRRFSRDTIRRYIRGADSLCRWLDGQGVAVVEANQGHVERYVRQHTRLPDIGPPEQESSQIFARTCPWGVPD